MSDARTPPNPLEFILDCLRDGSVLWTYHVNMRMSARSIGRSEILLAADSHEIIEAYPEDKYLPSYLVGGCMGARYSTFCSLSMSS